MTGLSRCGKRYPYLLDAIKAAELRSYKTNRFYRPVSCQFGDHWHVIDKQAPSRPDPFPPAVAKLLDARDEHCQRCGATGVRLERHHRRAKASGGSGARAHTQCACNGVRACSGCHRWMHTNPAQARLEGWIVSQSVALPGRVGVRIGSGLGPRARQLAEELAIKCGSMLREAAYPTCEGTWTHEP